VSFRPALVIVAQPLHPVGAWLLCRHLGPLIGFLVAGDAFVSRTPPDLYGDAWPRPSQRRNVLPRLNTVLSRIRVLFLKRV